jgi:hypothetical protein
MVETMYIREILQWREVSDAWGDTFKKGLSGKDWSSSNHATRGYPFSCPGFTEEVSLVCHWKKAIFPSRTKCCRSQSL